MSAVTMSLDEIIAEQKKKGRGGAGGVAGGRGKRNITRPVRRAGGALRRTKNGGVGLDAPSSGKRKNKRYFEVVGGGSGGRRNINRPVRLAGGAPRRAKSAVFDLDAPSGGKRNIGGGGRRNISRPVRRAGGAPRQAKSAGFDLVAPSGVKYVKINGGVSGGARRRGAGFRAAGPPRAGGKDSNDVAKMHLSNIAPTVVTSDLEELFADFDVRRVAVHYDEGGRHLGTADLLVSRPSANAILREFVGVVLDNKEMKFAIVDAKSGRPSIRDRVQRIGGLRGTRQGGVQKRVSGGGPRGGRKSGPGGAARRISKLSANNLDKELNAYMGKKKA